jgi:medium-chain acyl-[acyl-carrier-protein] hydrolase
MTGALCHWTIARPKAPPRVRLFCFCYAGGNAAAYLPWQEAVHPSVEICAVQLPGRGARGGEPPAASISDVVDQMSLLIRARSDVPFMFFGHSLGGLIAFELARLCQARDLAVPLRLIVSGCAAPASQSPDQTQGLTDDEFIALLRTYNGTAPEILEHRDIMAFLLPSIRADFALVENYRYGAGPRLPMPVTVLAGRDDSGVSEVDIAGWADETSATCTRHWFDGDHFFIHSSQAAVLACLDAALAPASVAADRAAATRPDGSTSSDR